jgi:hypothetical protein
MEFLTLVFLQLSFLICSVVDLHWVQCEYGSGSNLWITVVLLLDLGFDDLKLGKMTAEKKTLFKFCNLLFPRPLQKDVQAIEEAVILQKRTSSTTNYAISSLFKNSGRHFVLLDPDPDFQ